MKVTVEIMRQLNCYEPTTEQAEGHITATAAGSKRRYYKRNGDFLNGECYFHYPFVIDPDGSLWNEANRYLLQQLNGVLPAKHRTLESLADEYSEHINDSGKLRPLPKDEQQALVESLKWVANTEMTLAFIFALTTGARLQIHICNY